MQFDREKLKATILYTCQRCEQDQLGAVKLHKVLYFSDMLRFIQSGHPITGSTYRKRPLGPTCDQLLSTLSDLESAGMLEIQNVDYFGYIKKAYIPLVIAPVERLSKSDISLLDAVIEFVCNNNSAKTISEFSHNKAWELAEFGDVLPYTSAFRLLPMQVTPETMEWATKQGAAVEHIKSTTSDLGLKPFGDLRRRVLERTGR